MKTINLVMATLMAVTVTLSGAESKKVSEVLLCYGDSISYGTKIKGKHQAGVSWVSLLEEYCKGSVKTINVSQRGRQSKSTKEFIEAVKKNKDITHAIIFLGVNDLRVSTDEALHKCVENIKYMILESRKIREGLKITILSSPGLNTKTITDFFREKGYDEKEQLMLDKLRVEYEKCAKEQSCQFIDLWSVISPENYIDGLHPNIKGQAQIAKKILPYFQTSSHLFILSGQSNMARLNPKTSFIPAVEKEFGAENTAVVHDAKGGRPISNWYDKGATQKLYKRLMEKVKTAKGAKKFDSVTFIWMQGEADTGRRGNMAEDYKEKLEGLVASIKKDLKIEKMNLVIGRISDYGVKGIKSFPQWNMIREIQKNFAESKSNAEWVDCDDLNDNVINKKGRKVNNDLHYSKEGYKILGERFAEKAIKLIR